MPKYAIIILFISSFVLKVSSQTREFRFPDVEPQNILPKSSDEATTRFHTKRIQVEWLALCNSLRQNDSSYRNTLHACGRNTTCRGVFADNYIVTRLYNLLKNAPIKTAADILKVNSLVKDFNSLRKEAAYLPYKQMFLNQYKRYFGLDVPTFKGIIKFIVQKDMGELPEYETPLILDVKDPRKLTNPRYNSEKIRLLTPMWNIKEFLKAIYKNEKPEFFCIQNNRTIVPCTQNIPIPQDIKEYRDQIPNSEKQTTILRLIRQETQTPSQLRERLSLMFETHTLLVRIIKSRERLEASQVYQEGKELFESANQYKKLLVKHYEGNYGFDKEVLKKLVGRDENIFENTLSHDLDSSQYNSNENLEAERGFLPYWNTQIDLVNGNHPNIYSYINERTEYDNLERPMITENTPLDLLNNMSSYLRDYITNSGPTQNGLTNFREAYRKYKVLLDNKTMENELALRHLNQVYGINHSSLNSIVEMNFWKKNINSYPPRSSAISDPLPYPSSSRLDPEDIFGNNQATVNNIFTVFRELAKSKNYKQYQAIKNKNNGIGNDISSVLALNLNQKPQYSQFLNFFYNYFFRGEIGSCEDLNSIYNSGGFTQADYFGRFTSDDLIPLFEYLDCYTDPGQGNMRDDQYDEFKRIRKRMNSGEITREDGDYLNALNRAVEDTNVEDMTDFYSWLDRARQLQQNPSEDPYCRDSPRASLIDSLLRNMETRLAYIRVNEPERWRRQNFARTRSMVRKERRNFERRRDSEYCDEFIQGHSLNQGVNEILQKVLQNNTQIAPLVNIDDCRSIKRIGLFDNITNGDGFGLDILLSDNNCDAFGGGSIIGLPAGEFSSEEFANVIELVKMLWTDITEAFELDQNETQVKIIGLTDRLPYPQNVIARRNTFRIEDLYDYDANTISLSYENIPYDNVGSLLGNDFNVSVVANILNDSVLRNIQPSNLTVRDSIISDNNETLGVLRTAQAKVFFSNLFNPNNISLYTLQNTENAGGDYRGMAIRLNIPSDRIDMDKFICIIVKALITEELRFQPLKEELQNIKAYFEKSRKEISENVQTDSLEGIPFGNRQDFIESVSSALECTRISNLEILLDEAYTTLQGTGRPPFERNNLNIFCKNKRLTSIRIIKRNRMVTVRYNYTVSSISLDCLKEKDNQE